MATDKLVRFVVATSYERIPQQVIAVAKNCLLDGLGVALAGSVEPVGKIIISFVKELRGKPEAGVIGGNFRTCAPDAALANGVMAHVLDYDDAISGWGGHLTAVVLPAVLALSQRLSSSGKETLEAFIAGWEVGAKIGAQIGLKLMQLGWHPHAIIGPLAAAAAVSKILKLNEKQTRIALGISASDAIGLRANFGTDTKSFHAGKGARSGVVATLLAQMGFTASENILESQLGLPGVFMQQELDSAKLTEELGSPFALISPGVSIKLHPSCGLTQRGIDAMLGLKKEYQFTAEDVAEIECETNPSIPQTLRFSRPQTAMEGKFSMQYCLAAALLDGEVTLEQFTDEKVSAPGVQELMPKVKYSHPEGFSLDAGDAIGPQRVTVRLRDGRQYSRQVAHARGEPQNPISWDEITAKFGDCAQLALPPPDVERIIELVSNLESLKDIHELMKIVAREGV